MVVSYSVDKSEEFQRVLCLGGPLDGQWREVNIADAAFETNHASEYPPASYVNGGTVTQVMLTRYLYRRTAWTVGHGTSRAAYRAIYVHGFDDDAKIFDHLMECYKPPQEVEALNAAIKRKDAQLEAAYAVIEKLSKLTGGA